MLDWSIVFQIVSMVGVAVAIYVAIRIDLTRLYERYNANKDRIEIVAASTDKAHERIDGLYRGDLRS